MSVKLIDWTPRTPTSHIGRELDHIWATLRVFDVDSGAGDGCIEIDASCNVGIGVTPGINLDVSGHGRFQTSDSFPSASGPDALEVGYYTTGDYGFVLSFDRGSTAYKDFRAIGSIIELAIGASVKATLDANGVFYFLNSGGLPYAEIHNITNSTVTTITTLGVLVQVTIFNTNGESNDATPDHTNDHITIGKAGRYQITLQATVNSVAGPGSNWRIQAEKNNGATVLTPCVTTGQFVGGAGEPTSVSASAIVNLSAADTVEVWIANTSGTENYTVQNISLSVVHIGG